MSEKRDDTSAHQASKPSGREYFGEHSSEHKDYVLGLRFGADQGREERGKITSTIVLSVLFVMLLGTYAYLHGSTRFELFQPTPTTSSVQPIPIIPWEEYQKQLQEQQQPESTTQTSTSPAPSSESTTGVPGSGEEGSFPERDESAPQNGTAPEEPAPSPTVKLPFG